MSKNVEACLTCYGAGETVGENGPEPCPDCFVEGAALSHGTKLEWRLRQMERTYHGSGRETEADVLWLVHELRHSRDALLRILARCQDADEADAVAKDVKFQANEALGLYSPK
ncbi:MAG: hypothetical protein ACREJ3_10090 [Polyangiaceae bacterium]